MGYRSCVASVIYTWEENEWPLLKLFVEENFPKGQLEECLEPFKSERTTITRGYVRSYWGYKFICEDVKWYDSFPSIKGFNEFAQKLCCLIDGEGVGIDRKENWAYEFIRVGEDIEDIERDGAGDHSFLIDVSREIQFNL